MMRRVLLAACAAILSTGCVYKGGKVVDGTNLAIGASIRMKTADNKVLTGWIASQTDMLAEDWVVVE